MLKTDKQLLDKTDYLEFHVKILERRLKEKQIVIDILKEEIEELDWIKRKWELRLDRVGEIKDNNELH